MNNQSLEGSEPKVNRPISNFEIENQLFSRPPQRPPEVLEVPTLTEEVAREIFPQTIADCAIDISERLNVPIESFAALALSALSSVVGLQLAVKPKKKDNWTVTPALWGVLIAPPSEKKSTILAEALHPIRTLEESARAEFLKNEPKSTAAKIVYETKLESNKELIKNAARNADEAKIQSLQQESADLIEGFNGFENHERRFYTSDTTVEKLAVLLARNPNGLLVVRDELAGWFSELDKPGRESSRAFYLEAFSGKYSTRVDRITRNPVYVNRVCLTVLGTTQPCHAQYLVEEATRGRSGGDGLLQRFQLMVMLNTQPYRDLVDQTPNLQAKEKYVELFRKLSNIDPLEFKAKQSDDKQQSPYLELSHDAREAYVKWSNSNQRLIRSGEISCPAFAAHLGKYDSLVPSLALLFHLTKQFEQKVPAGPISECSMISAIKFSNHLKAHAQRIYGMAEPGLQGALALLQKLKDGKLSNPSSVRETYRPQWSHLKTRNDAMEAFKVLDHYNCGQKQTLATGARKTEIVIFHPEIYSIL